MARRHTHHRRRGRPREGGNSSTRMVSSFPMRTGACQGSAAPVDFDDGSLRTQRAAGERFSWRHDLGCDEGLADGSRGLGRDQGLIAPQIRRWRNERHVAWRRSAPYETASAAAGSEGRMTSQTYARLNRRARHIRNPAIRKLLRRIRLQSQIVAWVHSLRSPVPLA